MCFKNAIVLVTGGSRGIGKAIAEYFASADAKVEIFHARPNSADTVLDQIEKDGGIARAHHVDITQADEVESAIQNIIKSHERIDILINNAGITQDNLLMRMSEAQWDNVIETNLKGVFLCTKFVSKQMLKQKSGRIVNITSVIGLMGNAGQSNYAASKAGIIGFTKSMARELASRNITVNAIAPGFVVTEMTDEMTEEAKEKIQSQIPLKRLASPKDIAQVTAFLASQDASYITGQTISVDGGLYI